MLSLDISGAFWHVPLHKDTAHYLSFHFALPEFVRRPGGLLEPVPLQPGGYWVTADDGSRYQVIERSCAALPFGYTNSPFLCTNRDAWRLQPSLQRRLLHKVASIVGAPVTLDAFACHQSRVCPRYASRLSEPAALASDGLALDWRQEVVWLNPPWALLPDIIGKLAAERPAGVLIVPCWTTQVWWPSLLALGGRALDLPPPLFSVDPLHPRPVEPFLHPGLRLRAVVFQRGTQP